MFSCNDDHLRAVPSGYPHQVIHISNTQGTPEQVSSPRGGGADPIPLFHAALFRRATCLEHTNFFKVNVPATAPQPSLGHRRRAGRVGQETRVG